MVGARLTQEWQGFRNLFHVFFSKIAFSIFRFFQIVLIQVSRQSQGPFSSLREVSKRERTLLATFSTSQPAECAAGSSNRNTPHCCNLRRPTPLNTTLHTLAWPQPTSTAKAWQPYTLGQQPHLSTEYSFPRSGQFTLHKHKISMCAPRAYLWNLMCAIAHQL